jgi:hypothetical protein
MIHRRSNRASRIVSTILGAIIGGAMLWLVGEQNYKPVLGAASGVVLGGIWGYGAEAGLIGPVIRWTSFFAVVGALLAPGVDADGIVGVLPGAAFGNLFGLVWRAACTNEERERRRVRILAKSGETEL